MSAQLPPGPDTGTIWRYQTTKFQETCYVEVAGWEYKGKTSQVIFSVFTHRGQGKVERATPAELRQTTIKGFWDLVEEGRLVELVERIKYDHPWRGDLERYVAGVTAAPLTGEIVDHLEVCRFCRAQVVAIKSLADQPPEEE